MANESKPDRRTFLKAAALSAAASDSAAPAPSAGSATLANQPPQVANITYPRTFTGPALAMISFPLGGIGAGSIGLGGRGQLRDWEIFNRPDKGNSPSYAFPSIWVETAGQAPVAHILEARIQPPYEGQDGLGSANAPGLSRLQGATFTSEFPQARIQFHDTRLPIKIQLIAGSPFIPLDADESGLPMATLSYRVRNTSQSAVTVAIALSLDNPVKAPVIKGAPDRVEDSRVNEFRKSEDLQGLLMHNPAVSETDSLYGTFALAALNISGGELSMLRGWPAGRWWDSPLLFWDDFSSDGELGPEAPKLNSVGSLCLKRKISPGHASDFTFLLSWHFPNRTPERCGWSAPKGHEQAIIGNWYATRFEDAWSAAKYAAANLAKLQTRTESFLNAVRQTTIPAAVKDAAMSNLSTLVSTTCFRTGDGEFHGFEGVDDHLGCCFGNCTHVWNYETATPSLFPALSRSLRRNAFGFCMDERGALSFRQLLPDKLERWGYAAADGQMGQIVKVYLDWQQSGDPGFLAEFWPKAKRALEFAWIPGGWDANRDGVLEGVQHNTYDVEFYGPNPLCSVYYLAALRASEEMARASGDTEAASEYRRLFDNGSRWVDDNLFNGEYFTQKIEGRPASDIAKGLRVGMGADDPERPQYQVGDGCLVDQLLGQYLAHVCGLGPLLNQGQMRKTLDSIYRYNHKSHLYDHETVQRTFALNDEAALVICDYGKGKRPRIPFPYYAEVMTGFEYSAACLMLYSDMTTQGVECITDIRRRYDGVRRNPFDEAECGHHYARAMASWSGLLALSGFSYRGSESHLTVAPRLISKSFRSFWSAGSGWGVFSLRELTGKRELALAVQEGSLKLQRIQFPALAAAPAKLTLGGVNMTHKSQTAAGHLVITFDREVTLDPTASLVVQA
jgi:non-lysosomal glucosylceramidase